MIDTLILAVPLAIIVQIVSAGNWIDFSQNLYNPTTINFSIISYKWEIVFEFLLFMLIIIFWKKFQGATPGKKIMKIKIVNAKDFNEINNKQAIIRSLGYVLSSLILMIGFIMIAFTKNKTSLHDIIAKTVVIYEDKRK